MARTRLSTTVNRDLLDDARKAHAGTTDAELIDDALTGISFKNESSGGK